MRILLLIACLLLPSLVRAQAIVLREVPCTLFSADGREYRTTGHLVITGFDAGNPAVVVCRGQVSTLGIRATLDYASTGVQCGCGSDSTKDWTERITADGWATLVCHLHP